MRYTIYHKLRRPKSKLDRRNLQKKQHLDFLLYQSENIKINEKVQKALEPNPNLKSIITIFYLVQNSIGGSFPSRILPISTTFLQFLGVLRFICYLRLKGWRNKDDYDHETAPQNVDLPLFCCLFTLKIKNCPKFVVVPLYHL